MKSGEDQREKQVKSRSRNRKNVSVATSNPEWKNQARGNLNRSGYTGIMIVDCHIHAIGDGSSGSGCRLTLRNPVQRIFARGLLASLRLPQSLLSGDLDSAYLQYLLEMINTSSIDAAVVLAQDEVHDENGRVMEGVSNFYVPNDYVLKLSREHEKILPGVSIHPARKDAFDELEKCIEQKAVLLKCNPCSQNIDCSSPRYTRFWERMAEANLPLLAHTGSEACVPVVNRSYESPSMLRLPLECGVKVIAAHCGARSFSPAGGHLRMFRSMLEEFPNLYGDISGMMLPVRARYLKHLLKEPFVSRLVHGSDVPVAVFPSAGLVHGLISAEEYSSLRKIKNPVELDYRLKRAIGFPEGVFTGLDVLPPQY